MSERPLAGPRELNAGEKTEIFCIFCVSVQIFAGFLARKDSQGQRESKNGQKSNKKSHDAHKIFTKLTTKCSNVFRVPNREMDKWTKIQ